VRGTDRDRNAVAILLSRLAQTARSEEKFDEARSYRPRFAA